ncbi:MAG: pyridoxamine 5'-phosphate oxidase family protein [Halobacteriaceae archaeon]
MEFVENSLEGSIETFLNRPLFCFLGTVDDGEPRISPVWFLQEEGAIWIIADDRKSYPDRIRPTSATTVAIVDFERTTGRVEHVGMRGEGEVRPMEPGRARRLLRRYLGPDPEEWDRSRFPDPQTWGEEMVMIRIEPATVVARDQSYAPAPAVTGTEE